MLQPVFASGSLDSVGIAMEPPLVDTMEAAPPPVENMESKNSELDEEEGDCEGETHSVET